MTPFQKVKRDDLYEKFVALLPPKTVDALRQKSYETYTPMTTLIAIAVDNELSRSKPFDYPCELPAEYKEYMYAAESGKILNYLMKLPIGMALDTLLIARREFGIEDKEAVLCAVKELLDKNLIEYYKPSRTMFNYHNSYRRLRAVNMKETDLKRYKNKRIAGEFAHADIIKSKMKLR